MALDLEIAGVVEELSAPAEQEPARLPTIARIRDSHHQVARLIARGLPLQDVSRMTGYSYSRLSWQRNNDPSLKELIEFYRHDQREEAQEVEAMLLGVAKDAVQAFHERVLDSPEEIASATLLEGAKVLLDRAGYAPVTRSVNKNLNLNIGARLDAAREREK